MDGTDTSSLVALVPPGVRARLCEPRDGVMPGGAFDERPTVPMNPLTLSTVIVELTEPPCAMVRNDGEAKTLKSGNWMFEGLTLTVRYRRWITDPLVALTTIE